MTGYILAGGLSRRMGRDKALLPWQHGTTTLLDHMKRVLAPVCNSVYVVGGNEPNCIPDCVAGIGPLGGIASAVHHATSPEIVVVAVDLPFLTSDFVKYFKERCQGSDRHLTACKIGSAFPLCLGIHVDAAPEIDEYIRSGKLSVQGLLNEVAAT